jgi:hypothetical protein
VSSGDFEADTLPSLASPRAPGARRSDGIEQPISITSQRSRCASPHLERRGKHSIPHPASRIPHKFTYSQVANEASARPVDFSRLLSIFSLTSPLLMAINSKAPAGERCQDKNFLSIFYYSIKYHFFWLLYHFLIDSDFARCSLAVN